MADWRSHLWGDGLAIFTSDRSGRSQVYEVEVPA